MIDDPSVGWAGALLYNETTGRLIDGHARKKSVRPGTNVPVLVGRWSEEAEKRIIASLDVLTGMAVADPEALGALLEEIDFGDESLRALTAELDRLSENPPGNGVTGSPPDETGRSGEGAGVGAGGGQTVTCPKCGETFRLLAETRA